MLIQRLLLPQTKMVGVRLNRAALLTSVQGMESKQNEKMKPRAPPNYFKVFAKLSKLELSSMVVVTSALGFLSTGYLPIQWTTGAAACVGTALCAASAATINQILEIDRDAKMKRTILRPLPSGQISVKGASLWAGITGLAGTSLLLCGTNPVVASLGAFNIALYGGLYTLSKPHSEWNTWIGSFVGAIPPVMGWAAATGGSFLALEPMALSALLFLWQFPHFFAISWMYREDYARGQFQMISVNDPDGLRLAKHIGFYSACLAAFPVATTICDLNSLPFLVEASMLNTMQMVLAWRFYKERSSGNARALLRYSFVYLLAIMSMFMVHSKKCEPMMEEIFENLRNPAQFFKQLCLHEALVSKEERRAPHLCAKIAVDQVVAKVADSELESFATEVSKISLASNDSNSTTQ